jgi:hypothetical protein
MPENDDSIRDDLAELMRRRALTDDAARPGNNLETRSPY